MFPSGAVPIPTRGTARLVLPTLTRAFRSGIGKRIVQTSRRPLEKLQSTTTSPKFGLIACPGGNPRPNSETACSARIGSERLPLRASADVETVHDERASVDGDQGRISCTRAGRDSAANESPSGASGLQLTVMSRGPS